MPAGARFSSTISLPPLLAPSTTMHHHAFVLARHATPGSKRQPRGSKTGLGTLPSPLTAPNVRAGHTTPSYDHLTVARMLQDVCLHSSSPALFFTMPNMARCRLLLHQQFFAHFLQPPTFFHHTTPPQHLLPSQNGLPAFD